MKYKILIVDDESINLRLLERLFRRSYQVVTADSGAEALRMLELHDVALIISDQRMPGMTGIEFLKRASQLRPKTVRIILTGYTDVNDLVEAINSGVVYKYITKPWANEDLRLTVVRGLEHYEAFKERHDLAQQTERLKKELAATKEGFINLMAESLHANAPAVRARCDRMSHYATSLGRWLDLEEESLQELALTARFWALWGLGTPESGVVPPVQVLEGIPGLQEVGHSIRFQRADFDGTGNPNDISGEQIPLYTRVLSIVSAYDSFLTPTSEQPHATEEQAINALRSAAGTKFDPELVEAFAVVSTIDPSQSAPDGEPPMSYSPETTVRNLNL